MTNKRCKYWNDSWRCEYCSLDEDDAILWRFAHRVVPLWLYKTVVIIVLVLALYVGFVIGTKW